MINRTAQKEHAEKLRRKGMSYREIRQVIPVAKSTLSLWLREIELTVLQRKRLADLNTIGQKMGAEARRKQRLDRLAELKQEVAKELPSLLRQEFFVLGLALYWAEGSKQKPWNMSQTVAFGNSDPYTVLLVRKWFKEFCGATEANFGFRLHIHMTADVEQAKREWSQILGVESDRFQVTLKHNNSKFRYNKLRSYRGLVSIKVYRSTWLNRRIELWAKGAADHFLRD